MRDIIIFILLCIGLGHFYRRVYSPHRKMKPSDTMPINMQHEHYCANCGTVLYSKSYTRRVYPDDPNWSYYSDHGKHRTTPIGYIEVIDHTYHCPECFRMTTLREQEVIDMAQNELGRAILTDDEVHDHLNSAKEHNGRLDKIIAHLSKAVYAIAIILIILSLISEII